MAELFFGSWMINGLMDYKRSYPKYNYPYLRYPAYYVLPAAAALVYGSAVVIEDILSHLFGRTYSRVVSIMLSLLCHMWLYHGQ